MSRAYGDIVIIGDLPDVYRKIDKVGPVNLPVHIGGETGTGKELVARAIHYTSGRRKEPFIAINTSAIPPGLIESELFGHRKGAFTGAYRDKPGKFEQAGEGTIFLDEIGYMPPDLQSVLLRVLQDGTYNMVGGCDEKQSHARVLTATNLDLNAAMSAGRFREDLYYRICVVSIDLPPLRDRRQDIPELTDHFVGRCRGRKGQADAKIAYEDGFVNALVEYDWPGNIRELENTLEVALIMSDNATLHVSDLPPSILRPGSSRPLRLLGPDIGRADGMGLREATELFARQYCARVLEKAKGNVAKAAEIAGVDRKTFAGKLQAR